MKIEIGYFLFFILACTSNNKIACQNTSREDHVIELKFEEKSFVFSKIAKPGKVSVFILSTSWCAPCLLLKNSFEDAFKNHSFYSKDLDVYYCNLSNKKYSDFNKLSKNKGYINFKEIDQLTSVFPTSYILSPTTNCYTIISGNYPDSIFSIINDLTKRKEKFFSIKHLEVEKVQKNNVKQRNENIDSLKNEIRVLKDSIQILKKSSTFLIN